MFTGNKYHPMGGGLSTVEPHERYGDGRIAASAPQTEKRKTCCCFLRKRNSRETEIKNEEERILREEAKSWSNNFEGLLSHQVGRKVFQEFLQAQFSDENLRFWVESENYASLNDYERTKAAKRLYDEFVSSISPCEISLDAFHRNQIEKDLAEAPQQLFKNAQVYIYSLMYRDCFPRFLKSKLYKRLCR